MTEAQRVIRRKAPTFTEAYPPFTEGLSPFGRKPASILAMTHSVLHRCTMPAVAALIPSRAINSGAFMFDRRTVLAGAAAAMIGGPALAATETTRIDGIVAAAAFNGVVLVGQNGRAVFQKPYGMADAEAGRVASVRDRYVIASVSKWLTVIAILKLVEQGVMNLDATISDSLPAFRKDVGGQVRLRHLLTNRSGIPNLYGPAVEADPELRRSTLSAADAAIAFCSGDPIFPPDERFDYAITNWILVVAMVEAATGRPFERVLDDLVITPLGLTDTAVARFDFADRPDTAKAYGALSPPTVKMSLRPAFLAAAGGLCSTATDLLRAASGVFEGEILTSASRAEMLKITTPGQHYALGGRVARLATADGVRVAPWETGRTDGYRSVVAHVLEDRRTVVLLNNTDLSQAVMDQIALQILNARWA